MKITFIGVGNIYNTKQNNTSLIINNNILFECGMGTAKNMERMGFSINDLDYIFISHFHPDHSFDLPNIIIGKRAIAKKNPSTKTLYIVGPKGIKDFMQKLMFIAFNKDGNLEEYAPIKFIEFDGELEVNGLKINSYELTNDNGIIDYGYILDKDEIKIGYTGDTSICDNLYKMCEDANYMMIDSTFEYESKGKHIGLNDVEVIANKYKNCKFYAVHRSDYEPRKIDNLEFPNDKDVIEI